MGKTISALKLLGFLCFIIFSSSLLHAEGAGDVLDTLIERSGIYEQVRQYPSSIQSSYESLPGGENIPEALAQFLQSDD